MGENYELAVVTGTSGAAISIAEQKNSRKGKSSNPCDYDRSSRRPVFLSPPDESAGYTGGITNELTERTAGACAVAMTVSTHFLRPLVVKRARKGTLLGDFTTQADAAKVATERFGPLKLILGTIPAFCANATVRWQPSTRNSSLTNASIVDCRHRKQDREPTLTYSCTIRFASGRRGGTKAKG